MYLQQNRLYIGINDTFIDEWKFFLENLEANKKIFVQQEFCYQIMLT